MILHDQRISTRVDPGNIPRKSMIATGICYEQCKTLLIEPRIRNWYSLLNYITDFKKVLFVEP
jgi:hypothetical protein